MLYFSQLLPCKDLSILIKEYSAGIELIDFSVGMNLDNMEVYLKKWEKTLLDLGEPPVNIHGPFLDLNPMSYERLTAEASWVRFSQAYEAARCLGAKRLIFHTCRVPAVCYPQSWASRLSEFWNRFLDCHPDIPVSAENVFDEDPFLVADFASRVTAGSFSLCLDIGHAGHASDKSVAVWLETLAPWIEHLHLHDNHGRRDEHLALGKGAIDLAAVSEILPSLPRLTGATVENTTLQDCRDSAEFLNRHRIRQFL